MARLLIADDDPAYCRAFQAGMHALGHSVDVAHDAPAALTALNHAAGRYHVVFVDIFMRGGGGTLLCAIRRQWFSLPVVIITGRSDILGAALFRQALEGAQRRLPKSTRLAALDAVVAELS